MKPTRKQVNYALMLMRDAGYPTGRVNENHDQLLAPLDLDRPHVAIPVDVYLRELQRHEVSALIDALKAEAEMYRG